MRLGRQLQDLALNRLQRFAAGFFAQGHALGADETQVGDAQEAEQTLQIGLLMIEAGGRSALAVITATRRGEARRVIVHRDPTDESYRSVRSFEADMELAALLAPELAMRLTSLLD